jgi:hypothetical protein
MSNHLAITSVKPATPSPTKASKPSLRCRRFRQAHRGLARQQSMRTDFVLGALEQPRSGTAGRAARERSFSGFSARNPIRTAWSAPQTAPFEAAFSESRAWMNASCLADFVAPPLGAATGGPVKTRRRGEPNRRDQLEADLRKSSSSGFVASRSDSAARLRVRLARPSARWPDRQPCPHSGTSSSAAEGRCCDKNSYRRPWLPPDQNSFILWRCQFLSAQRRRIQRRVASQSEDWLAEDSVGSLDGT